MDKHKIMDKPKLILNGKEYLPKRPTMKIWRAIVEHDAETSNLSVSDILSVRVEILSLIYGIDSERIESEIDISDVLPAYNEAAKWIIGLVFSKLDKLPKAEGTAE